LRELRQQLEAAQTEARLLRGRLAAKEEEVARRDQEARLEKVSRTVRRPSLALSPIPAVPPNISTNP
jgi:hypothetical protein